MNHLYTLETDIISLIVLTLILIRCLKKDAPFSLRALMPTAFLTFVLFLSDLGWMLTTASTLASARAFGIFFCVIYFSALGAVSASWLWYTLRFFGVGQKAMRHWRAALYALAAAQAALAVASIWTGSFFSIDQENVYHRGPLILLQYTADIGLILLAFLYTVKRFIAASEEARRDMRVRLIITGLPLIDIAARLIEPSVSILWLGIALSLIIASNCTENMPFADLGRFMRVKRLHRIDTVCWGLLIALSAVLIIFSARGTGVSVPDMVRVERFTGDYTADSGQKGSLDALETTENISSLVLEGAFDAPIELNETFFLHTRQLEATLYADGLELLPLSHDGSDAFATENWLCYVSPGMTKDTRISLRLSALSGDLRLDSVRLLLSDIYVGTRAAMLAKGVSECIAQIIIALLLMASGFSILMYGLPSRLIKGRETAIGSYGSCGLLMIVGGLCTAIDYRYILFLFDFPLLITQLDDLCQMSICLLLLIYLRSYIRDENLFRSMSFFIYIWAGLMMLYELIALFLHASYFPMYIYVLLPVAVLLLFSACACTVADQRRAKIKATPVIVAAIIVLGVCTLAEIAKFAATGSYWIIAFQLGLLLFSLIHLYLMRAAEQARYEDALKTRELEKELTQERVAIMLSQIQPHFLYNALNTIGYLCGDENDLARQTIDRFAKYLRGNMDSLSQKTPIAFERELEHLDNYLYIERLRFGERLQIVYDFAVRDFTLPALTIQPLVENAIRYGVTQRKEGGVVTLSTRREGDNVILRILDNGVGFDPYQTQYDGRSHVGIVNTSDRLNAMCGGTLKVKSEPGKGTEITMIIPNRKEPV